MTKTFLSFVFFTFLILPCFKIKAQNNNGLLFEISGNGLNKPSYIFGSLPLANKYKYAIDANLLKYIDATEQVVTEVDFVKGIRDLADSNGARDYCYNFLANFYNETYNDVYIPNLRTNNNAEASLFSAINTGSSSILAAEQQFASRLGMNSDAYKTQWPSYKVMQYAVRKNKNYAGLQPIDSLVYAYVNYLKKNKDILESVGKQFREMPADDRKNISALLPEYIAGGKTDQLFALLKRLKNGQDSVILQIINIRTKYMAAALHDQMQNKSVFAAVNWLSLTNERGILQELRNKGYKVKAVKMKRDAEKTFTKIKSLPYETSFTPVQTPDGFLEFKFPGKVLPIQLGPSLSSWMHFDVVNGSYFSVSRVHHNFTFKGKSKEYILKKIDSLIYEKVPGTLMNKELIGTDYYTGYDMVSYNRNDDYMRIRFYITPYELIIIKCDGDKKFALEATATGFFDALKIHPGIYQGSSKDINLNTVFYSALAPAPVSGSYQPFHYHSLLESFNKEKNIDLIYARGAYFNAEYLDEDTFLLNTVLSHFTTELNLKELKRSYGTNHVLANYTDDESRYYQVKVIGIGVAYYLIAASYPDSSGSSVRSYFEGFKPIPDNSNSPFFTYQDTALHASVSTTEIPSEEPRSRVMKLVGKLGEIKTIGNPESMVKKHSYANMNTGEMIIVEFEKYAPYTYFPDSNTYWNTMLENMGGNYEYKVSRKKQEYSKGVHSFSFLLTDTNTSQGIKFKILQKGNIIYFISSRVDTLQPESEFISRFYNSFAPAADDTIFNGSVFTDQSGKYLDALVSPDSATRQAALDMTPSYTYSKAHIPKLQQLLKTLPQVKEESETDAIKSKIMFIFGAIKEKESTDFLKQWYIDAGDTSELQLQLLMQMALHKSPYAFNTIRDLLAENPPVVKYSYQLNYLFTILLDSARLANTIVPDLFPLLSNEDFKEPVLEFMALLADSNYLAPKVYEHKITELLILAKNELKRQTGDETEERKNYTSNALLINYTKLLRPFYSGNAEVKTFIDKCLQSTDLGLREAVAITMIKHNKLVHDSIWESLAKNDAWRYALIRDLEPLKQSDKIPVIYRSQEACARTVAYNSAFTQQEKYHAEDIVLIQKRKVYFKQQWGYVYFYKIKREETDYSSSETKTEWKLCMSGLQPLDTTKGNLNENLSYFSNEAIKEDVKIDEQIDVLLWSVINDRRHIRYTSRNYSTAIDYSRYDDYDPRYED